MHIWGGLVTFGLINFKHHVRILESGRSLKIIRHVDPGPSNLSLYAEHIWRTSLVSREDNLRRDLWIGMFLGGWKDPAPGLQQWSALEDRDWELLVLVTWHWIKSRQGSLLAPLGRLFAFSYLPSELICETPGIFIHPFQELMLLSVREQFGCETLLAVLVFNPGVSHNLSSHRSERFEIFNVSHLSWELIGRISSPTWTKVAAKASFQPQLGSSTTRTYSNTLEKSPTLSPWGKSSDNISIMLSNPKARPSTKRKVSSLGCSPLPNHYSRELPPITSSDNTFPGSSHSLIRPKIKIFPNQFCSSHSLSTN